MHIVSIHIPKTHRTRRWQVEGADQERSHLSPSHRLIRTELQRFTDTTPGDPRSEQRIDISRMHIVSIHIPKTHRSRVVRFVSSWQ